MEKKEKQERTDRRKIVLVVGAIAVCVIAWLTRPLWHWFVMIVYITLLIIETIGLFLVLFFGLNIFKKKYPILIGSLKIIIPVAFLITGILFSMAHERLYLSRNLRVEKISSALKMENFLRILPKKVAGRFAEDSLQYPRYCIGEPDIVYYERRLFWSYSLKPDGVVNPFTLKGKGALYVDMGTKEKKIKIIERKMEVSEGLLVTDNYK